MLLLNICAVTSNKQTIQVGLCFLSSEKRDYYVRAITAFWKTIEKHKVPPPITIVTDRELALMNCLDDAFLESVHILCI